MNILFIGPYRQADGWGEASRSTIQALSTTDHNVTVRPIYMGNRFKPDIDDELISLEYNQQDSYDIVIQHVLPHLVDYNGRFKKNIIKCHLETGSLAFTSWPRRLLNMDDIWINSLAEKITLIEAGIDEQKIKIIPQSFDSHIFTEKHEPFADNIFKEKFSFYFIGEWTTRKGISELLTAYLSEFTIQDSVILLIKTSSIQREDVEKFIGQTKNMLSMYNQHKYYPNVIISTDFLDDMAINNIHCNSDCFVIPSYGESFCIPAVKAMLFGNTPIVTDHTGMCSYIDNTTGWLIDSEKTCCLTADRPLNDLYTGHQTWFKPNILSIRKAMREAFENKELREKKSSAGKLKIQQFSHEEVGKTIGSII